MIGNPGMELSHQFYIPRELVDPSQAEFLIPVRCCTALQKNQGGNRRRLVCHDV